MQPGTDINQKNHTASLGGTEIICVSQSASFCVLGMDGYL